MSAENTKRVVRVTVELSDTDKEDGIKVVNTFRNTWKEVEKERLDEVSLWEVMNNDGKVSNILDFSKAKVAKEAGATYSFKVLAGNTLISEGTTDDIFKVLPFAEGRTNIVLQIAVNYNEIGADNTADDVDDRLQKTYKVHLETGIGSGLYKLAESYTVNKTDDLVKLVKDGEYTNLPGLYSVDFDKEGNEYTYQYTIDGDDIYANWVKEGSPLFGKVEAEKEYDELDANKDGVVSCEEALGKGWVWNNETSACELKGSSNTGSYVPNTATK